MKSSVPIPRSQAETCGAEGRREREREREEGWVVWELSPGQDDDCRIDSSHSTGSHSTIFRTLFSFKAWCFPSSSEPFQPSTPLSHPPRYRYTHTRLLQVCCIFVSSSGAISWCQVYVVWNDSHALCGGEEGWMEAQSTIALINTNSYARCSQVGINSQCAFSLGVVAHFRQLFESIFTFC